MNCGIVCRCKGDGRMSKRRGNGEGSIRKRKDGRWEGRYTSGHDPATGKQIFKNVLGKSQAEVREKLQKAIAELGCENTPTSEYTVSEWLKVWYANYIRPNIRPTTRSLYESHIQNHIEPYIGKIKLTALATLDIQKMYNQLLSGGRMKTNHAKTGPGLSNRTVRAIHMLVHACLEKAVDDGLIPRNLTDGCKIPPKDRKEMKTIPPSQIRQFLDEAERAGCLAMFYLELTSGLRKGELLALTRADLDEPNLTLTVNNQVVRIGGALQVSTPKTANSIRKIILPKQTVDLLLTEHEKHPDSPYLFPSLVTGGMLDPAATARKMKRVLKRAGIAEIIFN